MRKLCSFAVTSCLLLGLCGRASGAFHIMRISEVMAQHRGDPRLQFVELQMVAAGQSFVSGHKLIFQDAAGVKTGEVIFPSNVASGANGDNILAGTAAFRDAFGVAVDLVLPEGLLPPFSGRVCFDNIDCVAYGDFTGQNGAFGPPAARFPVDGAQSLTLKTVTAPGGARNNANEYELRDPTPRNNAKQTGTVPAFSCYFTDTFANADNWDLATPQEGLDLEPCIGVPVLADIGTADAAGGVLLVTPGDTDQLQLEAPIGITGLDNAAGRSITEPSYRVKLNLLAQQGIATAAFFARQNYAFDSAEGILDVSQASGIGVNFSVDNSGEVSDHIHSDNRIACLQTLDPDPGCGDDEFDLPGGAVITSQTLYTLVLDVEGDAEAGPLGLNVKLFPAEQAEPILALGTFQLPAGLGAVQDDALDHEVLIAALGVGGASLEVSDFSICRTPRNQKYVRCLSCVRQEDGSVLVSWRNPADAETEAPIAIAANGAVIGSEDGSSTSFTLPSPPDGDATITVTNYSGVGVSCFLCENSPPQVVIEGPETVVFAEGGVTVALDSTASTDGDDGSQSLTRSWSLVSAPPGANASLDDPGAVIVNVNLHAEGEYTVRLSVTDSGCEGSPQLTAEADFVFTVEVPPPEGGSQRPGDCNQDGNLDISDAVCLLGHLFLGTPSVLPCEGGTTGDPGNLALLDANGDVRVDLSDAVSVLNFLFAGGRPPALGTDCVAIQGCPERCAP